MELVINKSLTLTGAFTIYTYLAPFLAVTTGLQGDAVAVVLFIFGVGSSLGNLTAGAAADRFGPERVLTVILSGLSVGFESAVYTTLVIGAAVFGAFLLGGASLTVESQAGLDLMTTSAPFDAFLASLGKSRADFTLANPPFDVFDWGGERLRDDKRWQCGAPPATDRSVCP